MVGSHDLDNLRTLKSLSRNLILVYRVSEALGVEYLEVPGMAERLLPKVDDLVLSRSM